MLCSRWIADGGLRATMVLLMAFSTLGVAADTTGTPPRASMATLMTRDLESVFYEAPQDVHVVSENGNKTLPARILVVMIKDKGKAVLRLAE